MPRSLTHDFVYVQVNEMCSGNFCLAAADYISMGIMFQVCPFQNGATVDFSQSRLEINLLRFLERKYFFH